MSKLTRWLIIGMILTSVVLSFVFFTKAHDVPDTTDNIIYEESTTLPDVIPTEPIPTEPEATIEPQYDLPTIVKLPVERPKEEEPDIIKVKVRLYNEFQEGFNMDDGSNYIRDIAGYLHKHAPEGLHISAGCAMAYTEGGSGKKGVYSLTNNCFGIRATSQWDGWVFARNQGVVYKDYATAVANGGSDFFCAYPTMEESVMHYCRLISGSYYNGAFQYESDRDYLAYILSKGYGEEHLLDTWLSIIRLYNTTQYNF